MSASARGCQPLSPFTYDLPRERIAQRPVHPPESARLLVVDRSSGAIRHDVFSSIGSFLRSGDHLVFNDTKVMPARLFGCLEQQPDASIEVLLVEQQGSSRWTCLARPLKKVKAAGHVRFGAHLRGTVIDSEHIDRVVLEFSAVGSDRATADLIREHGTMPIPPYIRAGHGDEQDLTDYQSIFARIEGSIAAPTASLHFSEALMRRLKTEVECQVSRVTLHVGTASFQPIVVDGMLRAPAQERFDVSPEALCAIELTKSQGGRVIAIGTTVTRALETVAAHRGHGLAGKTELFIQPGHSFQLVDALVTNFHQPGTTHLLLVEALLGKELLQRCYEEALKEGYRFLSYGDGMMIV